MTRTTCDSCGKDLPGDGAEHFTVKMETRRVAVSYDLTEGDLDDQCESDSIHEMTLLLETELGDDEPPAALIRKDFDFCEGCYRRFAADPLGLERQSHRRFSAN